MLYVTHDDTEITFATAYDALTLGQYIDLLSATDNYAMLQAVCSRPDLLTLLPDPNAEAQLLAALPFLATESPDFTTWPVPDALTLGGVPLALPGRLSMQSYGQKLATKRLTSDNGMANIPQLLAIYLYEAVTGEAYRYQVTDVSEVADRLLSLPARDAVPLAAFFLSSLNRRSPIGRITYRVQSPTTRRGYGWQWLKSWCLNLWLTKSTRRATLSPVTGA